MQTTLEFHFGRMERALRPPGSSTAQPKFSARRRAWTRPACLRLCLLAVMVGAAARSAKGNPHDGEGKTTVSPTNAIAGSTSNSFTFTFRTSTASWPASSSVTVDIPTSWTVPQSTNASGPGYVQAVAVGSTAIVNGTAVSGTGPWRVTVTFQTGSSSGVGFDLTYGGGGTAVTAPQTTGVYTFSTQSQGGVGGTLTPLTQGSPSVTVIGRTLDHFSFAAIATQTVGTPFNISLTAQDASNNTVATFTGMVNLSTTAGSINPAVSGSFSNGTRTESVTVTTAGADRTITATNSGGTQSGTSAGFTVMPAPTTNSLSSSTNPSPIGSGVTFTATLSAVLPAHGTPTGTVQFLSDGAALGSAVARVGGVASLTTAGLTHGTHTITAQYAGDGNFFGSTNTLVQTVNPSPILAPVPDMTAYVLLELVVTNQVINSNLVTRPLTFGLGAGTPAGAWMRTNGVFYWMPSRAQARTTNTITVWMTDSGSPPVHATNVFNIIVDDFVELALGEAVMQVGQTSSVPVTLTATTGITNVQALLQMAQDRLVSPALLGLAPDVGNATLQQQAAGLWKMEFAAVPGQAFHGTEQLARLSFLSLTNGSAFVPLVVNLNTNFESNGLSVLRMLSDNGQAVVVERQSLLEALPLTNGLPQMILYGLPAVTYDILFSPRLLPANWQPVWLGTVPTNLWTLATGFTNTGPTMFFRAREH